MNVYNFITVLKDKNKEVIYFKITINYMSYSVYLK